MSPRPQPLSIETRRRAPIAAQIGEELLSSLWLRRLRGISFLGTLDRHPRSRRPSNRWSHSLGVAGLGLRAARDLGLDAMERRTLVAACMLHDVGHFPLSHAAEAAFARRWGADHHQLGDWIVRGGGPIPRARSLAPTLARADLDAQAVWSVIDPSSSDHPARRLAPLLSACINLDTLDGIPRVADTFRMRPPSPPETPLFGEDEDGLYLHASALAYLDGFWRMKDAVYDQVINLPSNILAEARLCDQVLDAFGPGILVDMEGFDDRALFQTLQDRGEELVFEPTHDEDFALHDQAGWGKLVIRNRKRYVIDEDVLPADGRLPLDAWARRYRHTKAPAYLVARRQQLELPGLRTLELERPDL